MKRRNFLQSVGAVLTASFAPALPAFTAPVVTMLPRPRTYSVPRNENALLDALFQNMQDAPELSTGTLRISLHTSGKFKINEWDADKVNAIIFGDVPGESAKPSQRETKSLPDRR